MQQRVTRAREAETDSEMAVLRAALKEALRKGKELEEQVETTSRRSEGEEGNAALMSETLHSVWAERDAALVAPVSHCM